MHNHPIEGLIKTAMDSIKDMVNVNTIVGDPVESPDGSVIIPVSKVSFGFVAGGGDFDKSSDKNEKNESSDYPFGGGSGAGVSVQPIAFMVVNENSIKLLPVGQGAMIERIFDAVPELMEKVKGLLDNKEPS